MSDQLQRKPLENLRFGGTRKFELPLKREVWEQQPDGSWAQRITVERMKLYFTTNAYEDGRAGEVFVKADRAGSLAMGALDAVATMMSIGLQYGIPLEVFLEKLRHTRFEPDGITRDQEFPTASSPLDLLAQWLTKVYKPQTAPQTSGSIQLPENPLPPAEEPK